MAIEGYKSTTILPGTKQERSVRDAGQNKTFAFSVDGSAVELRREVVSLTKCNQCHFKLDAHGGNRNTIEQCAVCHNPALTETGRPAAMGIPATCATARNVTSTEQSSRRCKKRPLR